MQISERKRIALVVPRFGAEVRGGAEKLAFSLATRLTQRYSVDVISTCAKDYTTWKNEYSAGTVTIDGLTIHRFAVDEQRVPRRFNSLSRELFERVAHVTLEEQMAWMSEQGPVSSTLLTFLRESGSRYSAVLFLPYLYATTYLGLPAVAERSILIPLAHDEWPIYMPAWEHIFDQARALLYVTEEEREFVERRFGSDRFSGPVMHCGIDSMAGDARRFRARFSIEGTFALYVGRVDQSKGCLELASAFIEHRGHFSFPEQLVFVGPEQMRTQNSRHVFYTGEVDEQMKWDALAACDLFIMPSRYESLSFAVLEAWSCAKPVLVNAQAEVLVAHCRKSNGGLWYSDAAEFSAAIAAMQSGVGATLGLQGRAYVQRNFGWDQSLAVLMAAIESIGSVNEPALG